MDTGFGAQQLYSACRIEATHYFPADGTVCTPVEGTGFLVQFPTGDGRLALVTNRHIAESAFLNEEDKGSVIKSAKVQWWQTRHLRCEHVINDPVPLYHSDPLIDIAVIPLNYSAEEPLEATGEYYGDVDKFKANNRETITLEHAVRWEDLLQSEALWPQLEPGEFVVFPGYPEWHDKLQIRPVMRSGLIASDPQTDYRSEPGEPTRFDNSHQVLFDAFSTKGNSGSPVYVAQRSIPPTPVVVPTDDGNTAVQGHFLFPNHHPSFLIGINATHYNATGIPRPNEHAGLSRFHKVSAIMDILRANQDLSRPVPPILINLVITVNEGSNSADPS